MGGSRVDIGSKVGQVRSALRRRIVVGVDGSAMSLAGVEFIAGLDLGPNDSVVIATIAELGQDRSETEAAFEQARRICERAAERLIELPCEVLTDVRLGHPVDQLRRIVLEEPTELLALGPRGLGQVTSLMLGSVTQSLLAEMPTSILLARPPVRRLSRVLLAVDGSPSSLSAAAAMRRLPLPTEVAVAVCVSVTPWTDEYAFLARDDIAAERRVAGAIARRAIDVLGPRAPAPTTVIRHGDPRLEIPLAAGDVGADLIVVGSRGVGRARGLMLGSVSRDVAAAAPCSVLVVASPRVPEGPDPESVRPEDGDAREERPR